MIDLKRAYEGKRVLVTGGLGFIGSNLAIRLVEAGAQVSIMDARIKGYGANDFNIEPIKDQVRVNDDDICTPAIADNVRDQDVIFSLAAQVGDQGAFDNPRFDAEVNCKGQLNVLEACRRTNPHARIVFPGSRFQYGRITRPLPVKEDHPQEPLTIYGINKRAGEDYFRNYHLHHGLDTVALRIANPYGPRSQMQHHRYGVLNWFIRQALEDKPLTVYGDGQQLRDYVHIDDLVSGLMVAGADPAAKGRVYNIGSGEGVRFREMANQIVALVGKGEVVTRPWPETANKSETGDYVSDLTRITNELDWRPGVPFREGLRRTIEFYREHLDKYTSF